MKVPKKNKFNSNQKWKNDYKMLVNKSLISGMTKEQFEHWGFLVYSDKVSDRIRQLLLKVRSFSEN